MTSSWLFLAASLWGAWFTYNAHWPMKNGPRASILSFACGWLTTELALHHVAWQAAATAVFAAFGAFSAWPGWLGLGITAVSWGGLAWCQVQAARTRGICEAALREGFGQDYFQQIDPGLREKLSNEIDWKHVARPFPIRRKTVERIPNIQYGRGGGTDLHLDVYRSKQHHESCPVVFQIHGGGWVMGSKDEQALPLMYQLAEMGFVCVAANYRLSPHATFPDHLIDLKRALVWIKEHVTEYGGNPDFVAVTGGSAGGHLCALMGLTQNDPEYQPGFESQDTSVAACVPYYGVYDFANRSETMAHDGMLEILEQRIMKGSREEIPEAWDRASPVTRVGEGTPPFFLIHGGNDTLVPVEEAHEFRKALGEKSASPHAYAELPGAQHAFELFPSLRTLQASAATCRFLALMYSRYLRSAAPEAASSGAAEDNPTLASASA
jgi:acetyl esterase/lipase